MAYRRQIGHPVRINSDMIYDGQRYARDWVPVPAGRAELMVSRGQATLGEPWETSAPKHVLMISSHCCIRVFKESEALRRVGYRVDSVSLYPPRVSSCFEAVRIARGMDELLDLIKTSGASILHVHNEPDWLVRYAVVAALGRPVIWDCHDPEYYRYGEVTEDETFAADHCDAMITVGDYVMEELDGIHNFKVPKAVVMSLPVHQDYKNGDAVRSGILYQGGATAPGSGTWRDFGYVSQKMKENDYKFDMYTNESARQFYPDNVRGLLPYRELMRKTHEYEWGWVGNEHEKNRIGVPNKIWEYLSCGTPALVCNLPEVLKLTGGNGIVYGDTIDEVFDAMIGVDWEKKQSETLSTARYMEDEIYKVVDLYEQLM